MHSPASHFSDFCAAEHNCASLTSITIPASVTFIGDEAFAACGSLTSVYFAGNAPSVISDSFGDPATAYYLPCTSGWSSSFAGLPTLPWWQVLLSYTTNAGSLTITGCSSLCSTMAVVLPATLNGLPVTSIGANAFEDFTKLTSLTIPASVTNIAGNAFAGCSSLTGIYFNSNAPSIDATAFNDDTNGTVYYLPGTTGWSSPFGGLPAVLATAQAQFRYAINADGINITGYSGPGGTVIIPEAVNGLLVTSIGSNVFGSTSVTSVTIPSSVTSIGQGAFGNCTSLTNVTIPASVTSIGSDEIATGVFENCTSLTSVKIPASVTSIGYIAFAQSGLTNIVIPSTIDNIGYEWFYGCLGLTNVMIPGSVTSISNAAFVFCSNLANVTIPASVTSIGGEAFDGCTSLTSVMIPASVTSIGAYAFAQSGLTYVTIPRSVTSIGDWAFGGCNSLTNATIPEGVSSLPSGLFGSSTNLTSLYFQGDAPTFDTIYFPPQYSPVFYGDTKVTVYYLLGTTGWSNTFGWDQGEDSMYGAPTALWNPIIQTSNGHFGVRSNQFGFNITGTTNIPIVVEGCTNLANPVWTPLTNVSLTNGSFYFSDPQWTNYPGRFYGIGFP
jgi:hypothetical protein